MEETTIVVMLKNQETGFLEKELGNYTIEENLGGMLNIYAQEAEHGPKAFLRLSCEKELQDWEYEAIFDYYDTDCMNGVVESLVEEDEHMNPVWVATFDFLDHQEQMEEKLSKILSLHAQELDSVYEVIADKRDDYIED